MFHFFLPESNPIAFYAEMSSDFESKGPGTKLIFDRVFTNVDNAYNNKTGVYKVPKKGMYVFNWRHRGILFPTLRRVNGQQRCPWGDVQESTEQWWRFSKWNGCSWGQRRRWSLSSFSSEARGSGDSRQQSTRSLYLQWLAFALRRTTFIWIHLTNLKHWLKTKYVHKIPFNNVIIKKCI